MFCVYETKLIRSSRRWRRKKHFLIRLWLFISWRWRWWRWLWIRVQSICDVTTLLVIFGSFSPPPRTSLLYHHHYYYCYVLFWLVVKINYYYVSYFSIYMMLCYCRCAFGHLMASCLCALTSLWFLHWCELRRKPKIIMMMMIMKPWHWSCRHATVFVIIISVLRQPCIFSVIFPFG